MGLTIAYNIERRYPLSYRAFISRQSDTTLIIDLLTCFWYRRNIRFVETLVMALQITKALEAKLRSLAIFTMTIVMPCSMNIFLIAKKILMPCEREIEAHFLVATIGF